jgi:hypothetical protein
MKIIARSKSIKFGILKRIIISLNSSDKIWKTRRNNIVYSLSIEGRSNWQTTFVNTVVYWSLVPGVVPRRSMRILYVLLLLDWQGTEGGGNKGWRYGGRKQEAKQVLLSILLKHFWSKASFVEYFIKTFLILQLNWTKFWIY